MQTVKTTGLFDIAFYQSENPDVAESGIDPLLHYVTIGALEGRNPHPLFDIWFYWQQKPENLAPCDDPLLHYIEFGADDGLSPHPLFDAGFYLHSHPEVAQSGENPLVHYLTKGAAAGFEPCPFFDSAYYRAQSPEGLAPDDNAFLYFVKSGPDAKCDPHPLFDISFYLSVADYVAESRMNPLYHYSRFGKDQHVAPSPFFDCSYYRQSYELARQSAVDPVSHYLHVGAGLGYNPSLLFDTRFYLDTHQDVQKQGLNPLVHYVQFGRFEGRTTKPDTDVFRVHDDSRCWPRMKSSTNRTSPYAKLFDQLGGQCTHLFLVGCLMRGGAERSACHVVHLAAEGCGVENVLVVVTDCPTITCAEWLPDNTRLVNLAEIVPKTTIFDQGALIASIIKATSPQTVHLFNSHRAGSLLAHYYPYLRNELQFLSHKPKFVYYLCGYEVYVEEDYFGFNEGALHRAAQHVDLMITDNDRLRHTIVERYRHVHSIESRAMTCYQPVVESLIYPVNYNSVDRRADTPLRSAGRTQSTQSDIGDARQKVLWASRLDVSKRPEILGRIAQGLPEVPFDVYGYSAGGYDYSHLRKHQNVKLMGEFANFGDIPKHDKAVFLYTSDADGMPNVLLEAVASELPVVAPNVGAVGELINDDTGWLVSRFDDVDQYVNVLKHVLSHPQEARARARRAKSLLNRRHTWSAFSSRLRSLEVV